MHTSIFHQNNYKKNMDILYYIYDTLGKHGTRPPNGWQADFSKLIFVSAVSWINLHKLALHHFLKQTYTQAHTLLGRGWVG